MKGNWGSCAVLLRCGFAAGGFLRVRLEGASGASQRLRSVRTGAARDLADCWIAGWPPLPLPPASPFLPAVHIDRSRQALRLVSLPDALLFGVPVFTRVVLATSPVAMMHHSPESLALHERAAGLRAPFLAEPLARQE